MKNNGLVCSMGRVAAAGDNAAMESFFSHLQKNVLDTKRWETRDELRLAIVTWIETKYNHRRRQRALGKLAPVECELNYTAADAAENHQPRVSTKPGEDPLVSLRRSRDLAHADRLSAQNARGATVQS